MLKVYIIFEWKIGTFTMFLDFFSRNDQSAKTQTVGPLISRSFPKGYLIKFVNAN